MSWSPLSVMRAEEAAAVDGRTIPARWQRQASLKRLVEDHRLVQQSDFVRQGQTPPGSISPETSSQPTPSPSVRADREWKASPPLLSLSCPDRSSRPPSSPRLSAGIHAIVDPQGSSSPEADLDRGERLPTQAQAEVLLRGSSGDESGLAPRIDATLAPVSCLGVWEVSGICVDNQSMHANR